MINFRTLSALVLGVALLASPVHAANVTDDNDYFGTVKVGDHDNREDTINFGNKGGTGSATVSGFLPADTKITFTYTVTPSKNGSISTLGSTANLFASGSNKTGFSIADSSGFNKTVGSPALVLASANIVSSTVGTTTIINTSSSKAFFLTLFETTGKFFGTVVVSYVVSAVPLPAMLPVFALAIAAMVGLGLRRKARLEGPFAG